MSRKHILGAMLALLLGLPVAAHAHGGHVHKLMGTVAANENNQLQVKTQDGKTVTIAINEKTTVVRGKARLDLTALKTGDRVVVDIGDGKAPVTAREIKLGEVAPTSAKK